VAINCTKSKPLLQPGSTHVYCKLVQLILHAYIHYLAKSEEDGAWSDRTSIAQKSITSKVVRSLWIKLA